MKFMHLSDLHLGKRVYEFSMLDDQEHILTQIRRIAREQAIDAVLISGDVYDKPLPPVEAVKLLENFLSGLHILNIKVFMISGNHDSAERVSFGASFFSKSGIHIAGEYNGKLEPVTLNDGFGPVNIYLLPFIKPAHVKRFFADEPLNSYTEALRTAVNSACIDKDQRNILLCHQFVTGALTSESEEITVGGSENVDGRVFDGFDYVALGHIHRPQNMGRETLRYSGTPLKYSFSEVSHQKSVTIVDVGKKWDITVTDVPLVPRRDMREIKGSYADITYRENYINTNTGDYIRVTLTDEEDIPDSLAKLRVIYPNIMRLDYDNRRTRAALDPVLGDGTEQKTPLQLFSSLYELQNGQPMSENQERYAKKLMKRIWEGGE